MASAATTRSRISSSSSSTTSLAIAIVMFIVLAVAAPNVTVLAAIPKSLGLPVALVGSSVSRAVELSSTSTVNVVFDSGR